ncbi:unnamed protein product [Ceutorhynchus assimilis]|uniref:Hydin adenylate kinase-like domain-containing protein n=1 Tax=Ceutorhynchus assimilis TaxID=467358 RepID=A0A9N9MQH9_9CUCU|nr:unnamed protein product [Ceutorhynchus assimilis]
MSQILSSEELKNQTARFGDVLKPLKAVIHGPPTSGKSEIAKRICRHYGALNVSVKSMIDETLEELRQKITDAKEQLATRAATRKTIKDQGPDEEVEEEEDEVDEGMDVTEIETEIEQYEEQIRDINSLISQSPSGKLPDDYVVRMMRVFLSKDRCQSHGFVLDGFPKTIQQAKELFGQAAEVPKELKGTVKGRKDAGEADEGEGMIQVGDMIGNANASIIPDFVVSLQADDDFLLQRIMMLPERSIQGTNHDESNMIRRLLEFRNSNTADNTVLNFFDEAEIHPIVIDITEEGSTELECILNYLYNIFGPPIPGFGLSAEEEEELQKLESEQKKLQQKTYLIEKQLAEEAARKEYEDKMEKWAETMEKLQTEEEKLLVATTEPARYYLMKYVFPTLMKGLSEVARLKPEDAVDYLAEFLFKENPEGKMFDPSYTRSGEDIIKQHEAVVHIVNESSK